VALALLKAAAVPVAAPSANRFTQVSPTTAQHVVRSLGDLAPLVLDGGPCAVGIESTVVDCTGDDVVILRPGMLGRESLQAALADLGVHVRHGQRGAVSHAAARVAVEEAPRAPGMADRHYAPQAEVWLFATDARDEIVAALAERATGGRPVVALVRTVTFPAPVQETTMPNDPDAYARALYAALHEADAAEAGLVLIEAPAAEDAAWEGVRDRLTRAAR
jgi:L-threonylcarbamoyladenylate synthase